MRLFHGVWLAILLGCAAGAWGETALFVPGVVSDAGLNPAYTIDATFLRSPISSTDSSGWLLGNWGAYPYFNVGHPYDLRDRGLIRFPLASLTGRCRRLHKARLTLTLDSFAVGYLSSPTSCSRTVELYRVTAGNAAWIEGDSAPGVQRTGAVCWAGLRGSAVPWAGAQGCGLVGKDFEAEPMGFLTLPPSATGNQLFTIDILPTDAVQSWIDHPETNAGILLRSSPNEALPSNNIIICRFHSDDQPNLLWRPRLELEYDAQPLDNAALAAFQPGVVAVTAASAYDIMAASLFSGNDGSYGGASVLRVGADSPQAATPRLWRALLKFDLARLKNKVAAVRALRLTLTVQGVTSSGMALANFHQLQLQRLAPANASWREGASANGALESGAATWSWLARGQTRWASSPAPATCASRVIVPSELHAGDALTFDIASPAFLSDWIARPETNAGFILCSPTLEAAALDSSGQILFHSDDSPQRASRPRLEVFYQPYASADPRWLSLSP